MKRATGLVLLLALVPACNSTLPDAVARRPPDSPPVAVPATWMVSRQTPAGAAPTERARPPAPAADEPHPDAVAAAEELEWRPPAGAPANLPVASLVPVVTSPGYDGATGVERQPIRPAALDVQRIASTPLPQTGPAGRRASEKDGTRPAAVRKSLDTREPGAVLEDLLKAIGPLARAGEPFHISLTVGGRRIEASVTPVGPEARGEKGPAAAAAAPAGGGAHGQWLAPAGPPVLPAIGPNWQAVEQVARRADSPGGNESAPVLRTPAKRETVEPPPGRGSPSSPPRAQE